MRRNNDRKLQKTNAIEAISSVHIMDEPPLDRISSVCFDHSNTSGGRNNAWLGRGPEWSAVGSGRGDDPRTDRHSGSPQDHLLRRLPQRPVFSGRLLRSRRRQAAVAQGPRRHIALHSRPRDRRQGGGIRAAGKGRRDRRPSAGVPLGRLRKMQALRFRQRPDVPDPAKPRGVSRWRLRHPCAGRQAGASDRFRQRRSGAGCDLCLFRHHRLFGGKKTFRRRDG